jgi:hypothetical protein
VSAGTPGIAHSDRMRNLAAVTMTETLVDATAVSLGTERFDWAFTHPGSWRKFREKKTFLFFWGENFKNICDAQSKERRRDRVSAQEGR